MRRGFKADAERRSQAARELLGLEPIAKLCPWIYADKLGISVIGADELDLAPAHAAQLLKHDSESWSGMTLDEDGIQIVVLNSSHGKNRQASTLMHELAHLILGHAPASVNLSPSGLTLLSEYSGDQEEEADWLGAALLLPEPALLHHRSMGLSLTQISELFGVSGELCAWRCRMTGVEKRMAFRRR